MAVNKINSRSPYFIVAAGSETVTTSDTDTYRLKIVQVVSGSEISSPGQGTSNTNITLKAIPVNFTSNGVYTWTGGNAASAGTSDQIQFKEVLSGTNQEFSYGCSTQDLYLGQLQHNILLL